MFSPEQHATPLGSTKITTLLVHRWSFRRMNETTRNSLFSVRPYGQFCTCTRRESSSLNFAHCKLVTGWASVLFLRGSRIQLGRNGRLSISVSRRLNLDTTTTHGQTRGHDLTRMLIVSLQGTVARDFFQGRSIKCSWVVVERFTTSLMCV